MNTKRYSHPVAFFAGLSVALAACVDVEAVDETIGDNQISFDEFLAQVYQEPDTGIYIVNGDEPIETLEQLEEVYTELAQSSALIVHRAGGVDAKWSDADKKNLTYCVSPLFGLEYNTVVNAMASAAQAWMNAADVRLVHVAAEDLNCTPFNNNVVFDVRPTVAQPYIARAFFPNFARVNRNILIDLSAFGDLGPRTLTGILRHELGHTLGFRHEHTRPEAATCFEDNSWRALTSYDSASVMHYPQCNGTQAGDLVLTHTDRRGAAVLYGSANLLVNGDASAGNMSGWTITANGGDGWLASGGSFRTSYDWAHRTQTVDLYAKGYDQATMASAPPITISERFLRTYCPDYYYLRVELLDASMNVVTRFDTGTVTQSGACDWSATWETVSHTFTGYGPNVRYVRWGDGGKDSEYWAGHYGPAMDDAELKVGINLLVNGDASAGNMSGWTITANGGDGWLASGGSFRTSYDWARRTQTVDLYSQGYDAAILASAPPLLISERFLRTYCPDYYSLRVELLDASMNVVTSFDTGTVTQSGACDWSAPWETVSHTFTGYGPNVRYVRWGDGGKDSEYWVGHYGPAMDDATVAVLR